MKHVVIVLLALAACGEDSSGGPYIPIQMFDSAYKDAQCKHLVTCGEFPDQMTCTKYMIPPTNGVFSSPALQAAVLAGKMYFDGGRFAACVALVGSATCDVTDADGRTVPDVCKHLFRGAVAGGGACAFGDECISTICNRTCGDQSCCQGTCVGDTPPIPEGLAGIGQSCQVKGCVPDSFCSASQICTALKTANMPCSTSGECGYGLACAGTPAATCRTLPTLAQACPDGLCRDEGQHCTGGGSAAACVEVGLPGATCASNADCSSYFHCDTGVTNKCIAYPALGASCAQTFQCADSATTYCNAVNNICTALKSAGDVCTGSVECASAFCDATNHCADTASCI